MLSRLKRPYIANMEKHEIVALLERTHRRACLGGECFMNFIFGLETLLCLWLPFPWGHVHPACLSKTVLKYARSGNPIQPIIPARRGIGIHLSNDDCRADRRGSDLFQEMPRAARTNAGVFRKHWSRIPGAVKELLRPGVKN